MDRRTERSERKEREPMATIIPKEQLRNGNLFQGGAYGGVPISFFWMQLAPGEGPRLHVYPYEEIFVIQEGHATFTLGENTLLFRDGSFRHVLSSWRVDQWVEVDRPAHAEGLRNQHARRILVPERFAQALDGRPAKIVGNVEECSVPCPLFWRHLQLLANS